MKAHDELQKELTEEGNFAKRVEYARKLAGFSQSELSRRIRGIKSGGALAVHNWEHNRNKPTEKNLRKLCSILNVEVPWMREGVGEMRPVESLSTGDATPTLGEVAPQLGDAKGNGASRPQPKTNFDLFERVRWICHLQPLQRQEIAERMQVSVATLGCWTASRGSSTRREIPDFKAEKLAEMCGVRFEWLYRGEFPVWRDDTGWPVIPETKPEPVAVPELAVSIPTISGRINTSMVERALYEAVERRDQAQHEIDQWTSILNALRKLPG